MSDAEDIAAAAAEEAIAETEEERDRKRKERLEQNRLSARESRKRKKAMIEELQRTVITLSRDNKELNDKNEQLRRQLLDIGTKVRTVIASKRGRRCDGLIRSHHFQNTSKRKASSNVTIVPRDVRNDHDRRGGRGIATSWGFRFHSVVLYG